MMTIRVAVLQRRQGFTLIELIVTMSIVILMITAGVSLANTNISRNRIAVTAEEVQETLRRARNNAKAGVIDCSVCACNPSAVQTLNGWEVSFAASSYTIRGLCGVSPTPFSSQTYSLYSGLNFSPIPSPIVFQPLGLGTTTSGAQTVNLSGYGTSVSLSVTDDGQIYGDPIATIPPGAPTSTQAPTPTTVVAPTATPTSLPAPTATPTPLVGPTATLTPTPTTGASLATLVPEADTRVNDASAGTNYGTSSTLRVVFDAAPETSNTFIRFNISTISGTVSNATLRLYVTNASGNTQTIKQVTNVTWGETTMTWNSPAPSMGISITTISVTAPASCIERDVTSWVAQRVSSGATKVSFGIDSASGGDGLDMSSREGANPPQLVVTYN